MELNNPGAAFPDSPAKELFIMIISSSEAEIKAFHIMLPLLGIITAFATIVGLFAVSAGI